jgi:hypothetical protein
MFIFLDSNGTTKGLRRLVYKMKRCEAAGTAYYSCGSRYKRIITQIGDSIYKKILNLKWPAHVITEGKDVSKT